MVTSELQRRVDALAEELGRSVAINDPSVRLLCASRHFGDEDTVRVRAMLQRSAGSEAIGHILAQGVTRWSGPGVIPPRPDLDMLARVSMPLRWRGVLLGLLMVIDPDGSLTGTQLETIRTAAEPLAALLYRDFLVADEERTAREETLRKLLGGDRTVTHDFPDTTTVLIAEVITGDSARTEVALRTALEAATRGREPSFAVRDRQGVLLGGADAAAIVKQVEDVLGDGGRCVVGVGTQPDGHAWIARDRAAIAVRAAATLPRFDGIAHWDDLGAYALLLRIPAPQREHLPEPLRALLASDTNGRLVETLTAYLDHAGSSLDTAAALHIHRTSLYYRLHRIEEITGLDLADGEHRLTLHLGLRLLPLLVA
ncbi:PucR family transcriptional regulator [Amycolatopsis thermophila]|uniref:SAM-dependent methyltransferase n=1 Tax=Amycolatopsis thermophila TaxID=206084 RepID=A0ABU0EV22_9PSEU|nr:helix-turn-helix domain-containing protein [Amycolatopsis thermophila]MDQ0378816.1 SAM-dependent methyltransferase [Amycolatopsis thermophila]